MHREKTYTVHTVEHRAGKAARLASWRKMTQRASFVGDGIFRVFPVHAHLIFPGMKHWKAYIVSTLTTVTTHELKHAQPAGASGV
jgi:hypothetical protein